MATALPTAAQPTDLSAAGMAARIQAAQAVAEKAQVQSLHTEESMSISGNSARQMVMQKLQRKIEVGGVLAFFFCDCLFVLLFGLFHVFGVPICLQFLVEWLKAGRWPFFFSLSLFIGQCSPTKPHGMANPLVIHRYIPLRSEQ